MRNPPGVLSIQNKLRELDDKIDAMDHVKDLKIDGLGQLNDLVRKFDQERKYSMM